jgi:histidine triad (HIT) family protein
MDAALLGRLFQTAAHVAADEGLSEGGYRVVVNTGPNAQQSVQHLHIHVLGGRQMGWPPG